MKHACSSSSAVTGATWRMLIKLLTSAGQSPQGRDNSLLRPEDGYLQLVRNKDRILLTHASLDEELVGAPSINAF